MFRAKSMDHEGLQCKGHDPDAFGASSVPERRGLRITKKSCQIEIYFSILQRKALIPNDFGSLEELQERLLRFQHEYEQISKPFEWKFTRNDFNILLNKIKQSSASVETKAA